MECPCCGSKRLSTPDNHQVRTCKKCGAIFGNIYKGDLYSYVIPRFSHEEVPEENLRYFDFEVLGSDGINRIHGWYDKSTKLVQQFG